MQKNKLYATLEEFNKYEQNKLKKFIISPYFNSNKSITDLFLVLIKNINAKNPKTLTKEAIWKVIYPYKPFNDVRYRKLFSELLKLVEMFLIQQNLERKPMERATLLLEAVIQRRITNLNRTAMLTAKRLSETEQLKSSAYYFHQHNFEKNFDIIMVEQEYKRGQKRNIESIVNNLDWFYFAEKLRYYCEILSHRVIISDEYNVLFIEEIIAHIKKRGYEDIPPIAIYYQVYLTQTEPDNVAHYFKLKKLINRYIDQFPENEKLFVYTAALNYSGWKINAGQMEFLSEMLQLYKDLLHREIIFFDGELSPWAFKNIATTSIRLKEFEWTEQFIHRYKEKLPEKSRKNAVNYNLAILYFNKKEYKKAVRLLQQVEYEDISYNLSSHIVLLSIYYETGDIEPLFSLLTSFRAYLHRKRGISKSKKERHLNFIKYLKRLAKILPQEKDKFEELKAEIEAASGFPHRTWMLEQIDKRLARWG